jgi:starvation-inducible DNA-binding protein
MKATIGISEHNKQSVADELSKIMADEYVLSAKTEYAHWNMESNDFYEKHKLFEAQYTRLDEIIDSLAERIRVRGHYASGTLSSFLRLSRLSEMNREKNDIQGFIHELLMDHKSIIMNLRENIQKFADKFNDAGSADFITGLMEIHEKMARFLRAHILSHKEQIDKRSEVSKIEETANRCIDKEHVRSKKRRHFSGKKIIRLLGTAG